ncbi:MAG: DUF3244 domain-containing protein [Bacteroidales bacterium]|nr:DUF3244 domain-containing protein [Bacteroidales bacterium]
MKKKAFVLAGLCAISLCTWEAQAANISRNSIINMEDNVPTGYEVIVLQGRLDVGTNPNAVVAGVNDNSVYIHFNQSFGNVSISIYNAMGNMVYNTVSNTAVQQTVIIPFSNLASGTYTVVLTNANGYAEGDFERN